MNELENVLQVGVVLFMVFLIVFAIPATVLYVVLFWDDIKKKLKKLFKSEETK